MMQMLMISIATGVTPSMLNHPASSELGGRGWPTSARMQLTDHPWDAADGPSAALVEDLSGRPVGSLVHSRSNPKLDLTPS